MHAAMASPFQTSIIRSSLSGGVRNHGRLALSAQRHCHMPGSLQSWFCYVRKPFFLREESPVIPRVLSTLDDPCVPFGVMIVQCAYNQCVYCYMYNGHSRTFITQPLLQSRSYISC